MQLTRFDRWLLKKFVHETHVYTMREIENPPRGVVGCMLPDKPGQRFHFRYIIRAEKNVDKLVGQLNANQMMFNTRIVNRRGWYIRFIAPEGKSLTWTLVSFFFMISAMASIITGAIMIWSNPELRQNILDAIEILKG